MEPRAAFRRRAHARRLSARRGAKATLAGKTHVLPDDEALARFGIEVESERGALLREGGFTVVDRYDGHTPPGPESGYAA